MINSRVAVTGMGAISGMGNSLDEIWKNLIEGKSGISHIKRDSFDVEQIPVNIAGVVKDFELDVEILSPKEAAKYDTFIHYALHGANEALNQANLLENSPYAPGKTGTIIGVGMGGFPIIEKTINTFNERGARRVSPFFIPSIVPNMASGVVSLRFNLKGVNYTTSSACASGSHAISAAYHEIQSGRQDMMVTGGSEGVISNLPFAGFCSMRALSKNKNPLEASRPFDKDRDGFVMGEGAGILVLENWDKAVARGAQIYGEVVGTGYSSDAHHITAPHPEGEGAAACMEMSLYTAGIAPEAVGYVNAHGTSTPLGDIAETKALKKAFGNHAKNLLISSSKSMSGHLLGASGGFESIVCLKALYEKILPPTINLVNQDPECDLDYIPNKARAVEVEYALNNSFGFGGTNSTLIFKRSN
ncbi:MAG: beta-ketoacyl-[acyl-carrier-protein] synthase II [Epsilonproteobacteria bacterium]|nr:MAG: beta-ketoacyl-[acyl-carrier-protein] synthase II [Campylobacterota bacterium]RLA65026.1 MAG: beta-ketoacyl-[acyl-carrier-protein] synthase II [Campylobacterota bacterium]